MEAIKGKHQLQVTGPADPTGSGEGFSYTKMPKVTSGKVCSIISNNEQLVYVCHYRRIQLQCLQRNLAQMLTCVSSS